MGPQLPGTQKAIADIGPCNVNKRRRFAKAAAAVLITSRGPSPQVKLRNQDGYIAFSIMPVFYFDIQIGSDPPSQDEDGEDLADIEASGHRPLQSGA